MAFRILILFTLLWLNAFEVMAQGGNKNQFLPDDVGANNSDFSNCSSTLTGGVYYITCSGNVILPNGNNNWVELSATPIVLTISGDLTLGGTDINTLGDQSDLTIHVSGNLNPGNNGNIINANMTIAGSINAGNNTDISGGLTISGNVNLGNNSSIEGQVQVSGDFNTGTNITISGNVDAGGNMNIGQNNNITGDISADTININGNNSNITGNVRVENDLNNNGTINGSVNVNGNLNNNGTIEGEYVNAPCTDTNSCGPGVINVDRMCNTEDIDDNTSACEPGGGVTEIHSLFLTHSGTALTCETFEVTVTACADADCTPATLSNAEVVLDIGTQSVATNFNNSSSTTASFDLTNPGSYNLLIGGVTGVTTTNSPQFSPSTQVTAVDTALRFSGEQTQRSGTNFSLDIEAIRTDTETGACVGVFDTTKAVEFSLTCEDPTACTESIDIEGTPVNSSTTVDVDFSQGSSSITANYPDVGRIIIQASAQGETTETLSGSSQAFVVKPYGIAFEVLDGIAPNSAGGAEEYADVKAFERAGEVFTVNLSAVNENGTLAPSFGQESLPETLEVKTHELLYPTNEGVTNGSITVNGNQVSFSEVGIIKLRAGLTDNDYLGVGPIQYNESQNIGRFIPYEFEPITAEFDGTCTDFYYMGQSQPVSLSAQAVNASGEPTVNYTGPLAKATPLFYAYDSSESQLVDHAVSYDGVWEWGEGVGQFTGTASVTVSRLSSGEPDGPFKDYILGWQLDDQEDGNFYSTLQNSILPASNGAAELDSANLYYGRLNLQDTYAAMDDVMPIAGSLEYWDGAAFVQNRKDNCETLANDAHSFVEGPLEPTKIIPISTASAENGEVSPSSANIDNLLRWNTAITDEPYSFTFELDVPSYLKYDWPYNNDEVEDGSDYTDNPRAEGTFGIYRGRDRQIYWRELGW